MNEHPSVKCECTAHEGEDSVDNLLQVSLKVILDVDGFIDEVTFESVHTCACWAVYNVSDTCSI